MMSMHQNRLQQANEACQAMMSDVNPFMSGMNQQQSQQASEQMMAEQAESDDKEGYKGKYSRGLSRTQLP